eukprot:NODE_3434_length_2036_cov_17.131482.p1 GENE.NODE_3434_length_2036_cov_17.131482~~NODE_3434_length_2036_cov_17.131482.p1  ORF type:complete len:486 (+),score=52.95 NODE_3434_length_2036_cov_17.131482:183-1640(+)
MPPELDIPELERHSRQSSYPQRAREEMLVRRESRSVAEPLEGSSRRSHDELQLTLERIASRVVECDEQVGRHDRLHSETDKRVSEVCELVRRRAHDQDRRIATVSNNLHNLIQESLPSFQFELDSLRCGLDECKQSIAATLTSIHVELARNQSTRQSARATQLESDPTSSRHTARTLTSSTGDGRRKLLRGRHPEELCVEELSVQRLRDEINRARTQGAERIEEISCAPALYVSRSDLWTLVESILSLSYQMQAALDSRAGALTIEHSHSQAVDTVFADLAAFTARRHSMNSDVTSKAVQSSRKVHPLHLSAMPGTHSSAHFDLATRRSVILSAKSLANTASSRTVQLTEDQERQMTAFSQAVFMPLSEQSAASSSRTHPLHFGARGPVSGAHSSAHVDLATRTSVSLSAKSLVNTASSRTVQLTEDQERQMTAFSQAVFMPLSEQSAASSSRTHPLHFGARGPVSGAHSSAHVDLATGGLRTDR